MRSFTSRAVIFSLIIMFGLLSDLPNILPDSAEQYLPDWFTDNTFAFGLDLSGGSHLLMQVDTVALERNNNQQLADQISDALREARIFTRKIVTTEEQIVITPKDLSRMQDIEQLARPLFKDPKGGWPWFSFCSLSPSPTPRTRSVLRIPPLP